MSAVQAFTYYYGFTYQGKMMVSVKDNLSSFGWLFGGILIGIGSRWSGGCTSGHGVCGLPRLSIRSLIAICIFMPSGIATATYLSTKKIFVAENIFPDEFHGNYQFITGRILNGMQIIAFVGAMFLLVNERRIVEKLKSFVFFIMGDLFGLGLVISGMCSRDKILAFLTFNNQWDPSLLFVMFSAVLINLCTFQSIIYYGKPLSGESLARPSTDLDLGIYLGPILFGTGWGITGLCPGPALANFIISPNALLLILTIYAGQQIVDAGYRLHDSLNKKNI